MISPYKNTFRVSQAYRHLRSDGTYHQGYDLVGIGDKHIYSPVYGTVIRAGWECATLPKKGFGQRVVLRVGRTNYYMYFGHLSQINVAAGQKLKPGDLIGVEGSTGHSTGSHLHWEIRINDIKTGYVSVYHYAGISFLSRARRTVRPRSAKRKMNNAVNGIFCRWTAARLHSTCYPAFVPALSGWKRKLGRFTGTES